MTAERRLFWFDKTMSNFYVTSKATVTLKSLPTIVALAVALTHKTSSQKWLHWPLPIYDSPTESPSPTSLARKNGYIRKNAEIKMTIEEWQQCHVSWLSDRQMSVCRAAVCSAVCYFVAHRPPIIQNFWILVSVVAHRVALTLTHKCNHICGWGRRQVCGRLCGRVVKGRQCNHHVGEGDGKSVGES